MGKEKSAKVLFVGDKYQISKLVAAKHTLLNNKSIRVTPCEKALQIAARHPSFFDLLITDIMTPEVNGEDFAKQFNKLSPMTKVIYMIP